jgi:polyisoprenoid-binding protein YceI
LRLPVPLDAATLSLHFALRQPAVPIGAINGRTTMRKTLMALAAAAALSAPAFVQMAAAQEAPAGEYVLDKPHSSLTWKVMHQGLSTYSARMTGFDIQLNFNPADVSKSKVSATIDPKSVVTDDGNKRPNGQSNFDSEIANNMFQSAKFPSIGFESASIAKTGDRAGTMTGNLSFLGVTKPVTLTVNFTGNRNDPRTQKHKVGFEATGSFKRSDFGFTGVGSTSDEVRIEIAAEFVQK